MSKKSKKFLTRVTMQAALISAIVSAIGIVVNYSLITQANDTAAKALKISDDIYKSKEIPRLKATPLHAYFYTPTAPEAPGQVKINISAMIENLSEVSAREASINFETEDWYGHKTDLFDIYKQSKMPIPHILTIPKNSQIFYPSYSPDAPASGLDGFLSRNKPFKVKVVIYWKDINDKRYVQVGFYTLESGDLPNGEKLLYFQPVEIYDSVTDNDKAWQYAKNSK